VPARVCRARTGGPHRVAPTQGAFHKRGATIGRMSQTEHKHNETKARLMAALECEIDEVLKAREGGKRLTLTEIEDVVLVARQRVGEKLTQTLIQAQEQEGRTAAPISPVSQQALVRKGKKTRQPKRV